MSNIVVTAVNSHVVITSFRVLKRMPFQYLLSSPEIRRGLVVANEKTFTKKVSPFTNDDRASGGWSSCVSATHVWLPLGTHRFIY